MTKTTGDRIREQEGPPPPTAAEIILAYWRERYHPAFRRGGSAYSAKEGRELKPSDLEPDFDLIERLASAGDAERNEYGVLRPRLPGLFARWSRVAWGELLKSLPDEPESDGAVTPAEEEFLARLSAGMTTLVTLQEARGERRDPTDERRSLLDWARRFAPHNGDHWGGVRSYRIWSRLTEGHLRIALRIEVFSQIHYRELAALTHRRFAGLCSLYRVGRAAKVEGGDSRAVELEAEFLADLLARPDGNSDGSPDGEAKNGVPSGSETDGTGNRPSGGAPAGAGAHARERTSAGTGAGVHDDSDPDDPLNRRKEGGKP